MSAPQFDLVDIVHTLRKRIVFVLAITVIAAIAGAVFYMTKQKKYTAKTEFLVSNPLYADRFNMFGNDQRAIDYFGDEDDIDKIIALGESDTVQLSVIKNRNLDKMYNVDMTKPGAWYSLKMFVYKKFNIKRTEYKDVELTYTDRDPILAADVANEYVKVIEQNFRGYYNNMKNGLYQSIKGKIHQEDSSIAALTDTLTRLRNQYGIYDIISPARNNIMLSSLKPNGKGDYGKGVELIQNIEAVKDQLVTDMSKHNTLLNQYTTGTSLDDVHFIQVITMAKPPVAPAGLNGMMTVIAAALLGLFFSALYVLIIAYYRVLTSVQR
jgi:uncharacterized protein involved in exopolysaccharide biosynthesis